MQLDLTYLWRAPEMDGDGDGDGDDQAGLFYLLNERTDGRGRGVKGSAERWFAQNPNSLVSSGDMIIIP